MISKIFKSNQLFTILLLALLLRCLLIFVGYHGDLNNNISWATLALERGLNGFYEGGNWSFSSPNQPPLTILLFYLVRTIWTILNSTFWQLNNNLGVFPSAFIWWWEKWGMIILIKLPSILADIGIGFFVYKLVGKISKNNVSTNIAISLASLWLFNPISWYNSSIWGQTDSIVNLLGIAAIYNLIENKILKFTILFTLSILFKGSLFILVPLLFAVIIVKNINYKIWIKSLALILFTTVLVSVWFHPHIDLFNWLFDLYVRRFLPGEIGYLTANGFNFWWLINAGKVLDSTSFLSIPFRIWGFVLVLPFYTFTVFKIMKSKSNENVLFGLALVAFGAFVFLTRIHERYLYPFFPFATTLLAFRPKLFNIYVISSLLYLINMFNLFWVPTMPTLRYILENTQLASIISILNLIIFIFLFLNFSRNPNRGSEKQSI